MVKSISGKEWRWANMTERQLGKCNATQIRLLVDEAAECGYTPDIELTTDGMRLLWIKEARRVVKREVAGNVVASTRGPFDGITAAECNEMLRTLGSPPLWGETE